MAARKGGLGRGLEALLPASGSGTEDGYRMVAVEDVVPNPHQPRDTFDDEALAALTESIREIGVLQPIVVRPPDDDGRFMLVAGERRLRASRSAGLTEIPAVIRAGDERSSLAEALVENVQREDLDPLEEAAAYRQLMEDFAMTHDEVAERIGKSRTAITNTVRLLNLPAGVQSLLRSRSLSAGSARALLGLDDPADAEKMGARAAAEGWSVRMVEDNVRRKSEPKPKKATKVSAVRPAEILELEERLSDHLGTNVTIDYGSKGGGKMVVRFGSLDDLERIYREFLGTD
jgi:ParB family chromosome partitioning protein